MVPKSGFYGWQLLGVLWGVLLINLAFPAYGSSVINTYMAADLHLDRKMLGLPYSIYLIMSGLPAPLVALCVNRKGVRFTLLLGGAMVIVGSLLMALFVSSGIGAVLAFGLIVGTGVATGGALATQTSVTRWFVRRRALALAILLSGGGIGGFIAAPLLDRVIRLAGGNSGWAYDRYGTYNYCFYFIAAVCFGGVVLLLAIRPPTRRVNVAAAAGASS
jgi:MFS family permease